MVMTDPTADYLTKIRNVGMAKHSSAEIPASSMKKSLSEILKNEGFVRDYWVEDDDKQGVIKIFLKYGPSNGCVISGLRRTLKPGLRNYVSTENLPKVLSGLGIAIIPTSVGVIIDKKAREKSVGGEVIAYVR